MLTSEGLGLSIKAELYVFYLPNIINPTYIQQLRNLIHLSIENFVQICKQIHILILYQVGSLLLILLKLIFLYVNL
jgi:hypothetical protein